MNDVDQYAYLFVDNKVTELLGEDIDKLLQNPDN